MITLINEIESSEGVTYIDGGIESDNYDHLDFHNKRLAGIA
jgi:hypothetical protein